ncbi:hypothetical protein [Streptomyces yatensis]|nr:hypothetical protein [Streptomyces yatensis]
MNVTIPVGAQVPGDVVVTCAHKVTDSPHTGEAGVMVNAVVDAA